MKKNIFKRKSNFAFMRFHKKYHLVLLSIFISFYQLKASNVTTIVEVEINTSYFQQVISGVVMDANEMPLPGTTILEKGTKNGTTSDFDGNFTINTASSDAILVISYVGYITKEVALEGETTIKVILEQDIAGLDEIVVIGYGTQKKSDLTGSVASIAEKDFQNQSITSADQMLQGRVAGLSVSQSSAQPGGGVSIRIRGNSSLNTSNEPLYVIDGIPISNTPPILTSGTKIPSNGTTNPLSGINPQDIKSVEVLKDASAAAIYGSRGANGVILITTKSGFEGDIKINYSATSGFQTVARKVDILNGPDFVKNVGAILQAEGSSLQPGLTDASIDTDWQDEVFQNAFTQQHNISVSGGTANSKVFASANYTNQDGVVQGSSFERIAARVNWDVKKGKFSGSANVSTSLVHEDILPFGSRELNVNLNSGIISTVLGMPSSYPVRDVNGDLTNPFEVTLENPFNIIKGISVKNRTARTFVNLKGAYQIFNDLEASVRVGTDVSNARRDGYRSTQTIAGASVGGVANVLTSQSYNYTVEALLNYNKSINEDHILGVLGGYTYQGFDTQNFSASTQGFLDDQIGTNNLGAGNQAFHQLSSSKIKDALASFLGRVNYTYLDKLLFTASVRADGSSRFAEGNKWGVFPSFSLGYKLSEENFLESIESINTLKVRLGWGQIGNVQTPVTATVNSFDPGSTAVLGDSQIVGLTPARLPNRNLSWETTEQLNFGIDFSLLNYRVNGSIDLYNKKTKDLLFAQPVPLQTGFTSQFVNLKDSEISNKGIEIAINTVNLAGKLGWKSAFNFTANKNEIISLGENNQIIGGGAGASGVNRVGEAAFSYFGYQDQGVWQIGEDPTGSAQPNAIPGQPKWVDVSGDGEINADDRTILGDPYADFTWGFTNTFKYSNFELSIFIEGVQGVELFSSLMASQTYLPFDDSRNRLAEPILNRWTPDNPTNKYPSYVNVGSYGGDNTNSFVIQDASFIRLKNVALSYNFDLSNLKFINDLSLSISGQNLALFTDYLGFDPDVTGADNYRSDLDSYPNATTVLLGINVGF